MGELIRQAGHLIQFSQLCVASVFRWLASIVTGLGIITFLRDELLPQLGEYRLFKLLPGWTWQTWAIAVLIILVVAVLEGGSRLYWTERAAHHQARLKDVIVDAYRRPFQYEEELKPTHITKLVAIIVVVTMAVLWGADRFFQHNIRPLGDEITRPRVSYDYKETKYVCTDYLRNDGGLIVNSRFQFCLLNKGNATADHLTARVFMADAEAPENARELGFYTHANVLDSENGLCHAVTLAISTKDPGRLYANNPSPKLLFSRIRYTNGTHVYQDDWLFSHRLGTETLQAGSEEQKKRMLPYVNALYHKQSTAPQYDFLTTAPQCSK